MKFSQEYIVSQINQSQKDIKKYKSNLDIEREYLSDFLISQGYKRVKNLYVHSDFLEDWQKRKDGYYGDLPE